MGSESDDDDPVMYPYDPFKEVESPFDYQDPLVITTLIQAVQVGNINEIHKLIKAGKSVRIIDNNGNSLLHHAVANYSNEVVRVLLKYDVDLNHQNFTGNTALLWALQKCSSLSIITQLLEAGCDTNIRNNFQETALHIAVTLSTIEIIHELIKHGADINAQDGSDFTPLHQAVACNNLPAVCALLYYNADTSMLCHNRLTPFMYSLNNLEAFEITKILFDYYDDFTNLTSTGDTSLLLAILHKNPVVHDLINAGVGRGFRSEDLIKALQYALEFGTLEAFELIITTQFFNNYTTEFDCVHIMQYLSRRCHYSPSDWIECFHLLLKVILKHSCNVIRGLENILLYLLEWLFNKSIDPDKKLGVIYACLSVGVIVEPCHIFKCFSLFGNGYEVEALFYCYNPRLCCDILTLPCIPLHYFDMLILRNGLHCIKAELEMLYCDCLKDFVTVPEILQTSLIHYLGYTSFSPNKLQMLTTYNYDKYQNLIHKRLTASPVVASLLELSRNAAALHIAYKFDIKLPYQFYDIVKRINIANVLKEILLFRKPVYYIE